MQTDTQQTIAPEFPVRRIGIINGLGLWTLYVKEVRRFAKVGFQTILAPVISTLLFLLVFTLAFGDLRPAINGIAFTQFLVPGLVMMAILNNSFANSSSSLIVSKVQGNAVDFLMPPLSAAELAIAFIAGAATRGIVVGTVGVLCIFPFMPLTLAHPFVAMFYGLNAAMMMGMVGLMAGIYAQRFDHLSAVQNFVLLPLTFLSGTFYSVKILPPVFQHLSAFNPFFYLIDGFRYGFTGVADGSIIRGVIFVGAINLVLALASYAMLRSGWRLKT
ncbi:MAG: multidrug ABC transporter permease [Robiginitomaculum sp.]|nr:MAG: multidrug ABC transporter permease [Robiginitomaculum sp.]